MSAFEKSEYLQSFTQESDKKAARAVFETMAALSQTLEKQVKRDRKRIEYEGMDMDTIDQLVAKKNASMFESLQKLMLKQSKKLSTTKRVAEFEKKLKNLEANLDKMERGEQVPKPKKARTMPSSSGHEGSGESGERDFVSKSLKELQDIFAKCEKRLSKASTSAEEEKMLHGPMHDVKTEEVARSILHAQTELKGLKDKMLDDLKEMEVRVMNFGKEQ